MRIPSVMTTHNRVICVAHGRGLRQAPRATKGAAVWVHAANSALIWMAVLAVWFALRTAAGCWSRTRRAERQQSHLWRPVSRCASLRAMPVAAANGIEISYTDSGARARPWYSATDT